jgi:hypothetical protein
MRYWFHDFNLLVCRSARKLSQRLPGSIYGAMEMDSNDGSPAGSTPEISPGLQASHMAAIMHAEIRQKRANGLLDEVNTKATVSKK